MDPTSTKKKEKMETTLKIKKEQEMKEIMKLANMSKIITIMIDVVELEEENNNEKVATESTEELVAIKKNISAKSRMTLKTSLKKASSILI